MLRGKCDTNNLKNACSLLWWPTHITRTRREKRSGRRKKMTKRVKGKKTQRWRRDGKRKKKRNKELEVKGPHLYILLSLLLSPCHIGQNSTISNSWFWAGLWLALTNKIWYKWCYVSSRASFKKSCRSVLLEHCSYCESSLSWLPWWWKTKWIEV